MEILMKALPAGPEEWSEEKIMFADLEFVASSCEINPFRVSYGASWNDFTRKQTADDEIQKVIAPKTKSNA